MSSQTDIADAYLKLESELIEKLKIIKFNHKVSHVYKPLEYAKEPHERYIRKYCNSKKKILFLGMNPGPWGMAQTGVPFGEINMVKNFLNITGHVDKPENEFKERSVDGFDCTRSEVSGQKFWTLIETLSTSDNFFKYSFVQNYCPLLLMKEKGKHISLEDLKKSDVKEVLEICDKFLFEIIKLLEIEIIVGVGRLPEKRANEIIKMKELKNIYVIYLPHPSPVNVRSRNSWAEEAKEILLNNPHLQQYFIQSSVL